MYDNTKYDNSMYNTNMYSNNNDKARRELRSNRIVMREAGNGDMHIHVSSITMLSLVL